MIGALTLSYMTTTTTNNWEGKTHILLGYMSFDTHHLTHPLHRGSSGSPMRCPSNSRWDEDKEA